MHDPAIYHKHPFVLETFYREMAAMITNSDLSDPSAVLKPMIEAYRRQEDAWIQQALQRLPQHVRNILNREIGQPWWRVMPMVLPPFQSNHELSLVYALYRLMTSGNMAFMIGPDLSNALFRTDYEIRMDELTFPSDTFVVYYRDSEIPVYGRPLKWLFCDRIRSHEGHRELSSLWFDRFPRLGIKYVTPPKKTHRSPDVLLLKDQLCAVLAPRFRHLYDRTPRTDRLLLDETTRRANAIHHRAVQSRSNDLSDLTVATLHRTNPLGPAHPPELLDIEWLVEQIQLHVGLLASGLFQVALVVVADPLFPYRIK
jgi:hypothetical protein